MARSGSARQAVPGNLEHGAERAGVDGNRVGETARVAPTQGHSARNAALGARREHEAIARKKSGARDAEIAELVFLEWVGARLIDHELRLRSLEDARQGTRQLVQIAGIARVVLETDVPVASLLHRIEVLLMDGEGENAVVALENARGAVSLVQIAVHHRRAPDLSVALQDADADRDVIQIAEARCHVGEGVMEPAAAVGGEAPRERF